MSQEPSKYFVKPDHAIHVFTVSAALFGVCLTVLGIMRHLGRVRALHDGQKLIAINAFLFLICCILSYAAFKTHNDMKQKKLFAIIADYLFIVAMSLMAVICSCI